MPNSNWKTIDRENRERLAKLQQTLPQIQCGIDELSQRIEVLERGRVEHKEAA